MMLNTIYETHCITHQKQKEQTKRWSQTISTQHCTIRFLRMTSEVLIFERVKNPTFPAMLKIYLRELILTGMLESGRPHFKSARETETKIHFQRVLYA